MNKTAQLLVILLIVFVSCKKKTSVKEYTPPDSSYGLIYTKIFVPSCALSGCHAQEDHAAQGHSHAVTLSGEGVHGSLINALPKNSRATAAGLKLIVPNDTANSFLYQKANYSKSIHKYGAPMPGGGLFVTNNQIEFLQKWILAGAPKEGHVVDKTLIN